MLEEYVESVVFDLASGHYGLMEDYARAFINQVNFFEIYDNMKDEYQHNKKLENE